MKYTNTQKFMLYSLGKWFEEANRKIKSKTLKVSISKTTFIELVNNAAFARKKNRALYKNLETLEKKKLIVYKNRELSLTPKGEKLYSRLNKEIQPFFNVLKKLKDKSPTSYTKKVQTVFK